MNDHCFVFELDDHRSVVACPFCGHSPIYFQECDHCDEGYTDPANEDPINFTEGEELELCSECRGQGHMCWCPKCGKDIWDDQVSWEEGS